jgi:hypothetical protein
MDNNNKPQNDPREKTAPKEDDPVQMGRKAIEIQKMTCGKSKEEAEKEAAEDAERWRNEG